MKSRTPNLKRLLSYKNREVVACFCKNLGVSKKFGSMVFQDMLRYLYLVAKARQLRELQRKGRYLNRKIPKVVLVLEPMLIIDEMWHTFVLYTREYTEFTQKYFGIFMHHDPARVLKVCHTSSTDKLNRKELFVYLKFVWDELGEEVVNHWFDEYPQDYNKKKILKLQLKAVDAA